jgi:phosphinothricin acetyltransferase
MEGHPAGVAREIRLGRETDGAELARIYAPVVRESHHSFELDAPDAREMARRVRKTLQHAPWLVWESDGTLLGYAAAQRFRPRAAYAWTAEVSVQVADAARRRGIARALYAELLALLEAQCWRSAVALIAPPNAPSVALHAALGFEPAGVLRDAGHKLGAWRDVQWWQRRLSPGSAPAPPRPVAEAWALRTGS